MLLDISNLNLWFLDHADADSRYTQVLHDVSLRAAAGKTTAIVGESGSGKSVTALSILRLLEESSDVRTEGSIRFDGKELLELPLPSIRNIRGNRIAMIFQEPMTSLNPVYPVGNQLMEPLLLHRSMARAEAEKEAVRLLDRTGIDNPEERMGAYPYQLSGGQRQRVMIAMALACRPKLLIADEPTTALDVTIQVQILKLIQDIQSEYNMALLLITHDLLMVRKIADTLCIMRNGRVVESGDTEAIFGNPQDPYTRHLMSVVPSGTADEKEPGPVLLSTANLNCRFTLTKGWKKVFKRDTKIVQAVDDVTLQLNEGVTCGVVGESGSGKSTLAMAILKLVHSSGDIVFADTHLQNLSNRQLRPLRSDFQIVFQDPFSSLSPRLTVYQIIEEGLRVHRKSSSRSEREQEVFDALREVGLEEDMASRYPHEFSGGQRQRIAIARAVVLKPRLLILDEPTSALDVTIQAQIIDLLKELQKRYRLTYIFISHDLRVVRSISDFILVMRRGKVIESGPAREIFSNPTQEYTRQLFQAALC